ncbi:MAG: peptidylprolyl isomerase [Culturomica sp.]|jgi:peptidyl-prolyl cis-trans isomerase SurA|nr:peptidylprolyl isomerase [Culturomica sp.]
MRNLILFLVFIASTSFIKGQKNVIDKIVAVVGEEVILLSDIENTYIQDQEQQLISSSSDYRADILERLLIQKLLVAQAKVDSVVVTEAEVEGTVQQRIDYFISSLGTKERVESYFKKPIEEIKSDLRSPIREQLTAESMQQHIVEKIRVTPSEVRTFYRKTSKDSLPEIPDKFELQQIVIKPVISDTEKERIRNSLREFREQITNGEKTFNTLAVLYSEDGSATRGGELGYMSKSEMVPEFADVAFNLKPGKISKIVETEYGFHIMQLIDRQGEKVNVRHIILQPKVSDKEKQDALNELDTIRKYVVNDEMTFEDAAYYFSTDKNTKNNGGLIAGEGIDAKLERAEIKGDMAKQVNKMKVGEISSPFIEQTEHGEEFKIVKIKAFYPKHTANLEEDWSIFENMLKNEKRFKILDTWIKDKQKDTYISIDKIYRNSNFKYKGWIK